MRSIVAVSALACALSLAVIPSHAHAAPASKSGQGTLVIVFKDGHRQSFNLSEIERVEFPTPRASASAVAPDGSPLPSRTHFLGKWEVGDGMGGTFFITLEQNGDATRTLHRTHGKWVYVDGEARITWDDGWQDAIRKVGSKYQKFAYGSGKTFTDTPDNVSAAQSASPHPI
jgi:hypothetical protein